VALSQAVQVADRGGRRRTGTRFLDHGEGAAAPPTGYYHYHHPHRDCPHHSAAYPYGTTVPTRTRRRSLLLRLLPSLRLPATAIAKRLVLRGEAQDREAEGRCSLSYRLSIRIWYPEEEVEEEEDLRRQGCTAAALAPTIRARLCSADADRLHYTSPPQTPSRSAAAAAVDLARRPISSRRRCRTKPIEEGTAAVRLRTRTLFQPRNPPRPSLLILTLIRIRIRTRSRPTTRQAPHRPVVPPSRPAFRGYLLRRPMPARQAAGRRRRRRRRVDTRP
jgi:hypothetical protein